jgi:hypothetical protein
LDCWCSNPSLGIFWNFCDFRSIFRDFKQFLVFTGIVFAFVLAGATPASSLVPAQMAIFAGGCPPTTPEPQCSLAGDISTLQHSGFSKMDRNK